jgi:outer membrane biosynthesis protein TonB
VLSREKSGARADMKRLLNVVGVVVLAMDSAVAMAQNGGSFAAPKLMNAGDIPYPMSSNSAGIVTLQVNLDGNGNTQHVQVVRDVPPLTSAAQAAVQGWTFTAATRNGSGVASSIAVTAAFNPFNPSGVALPSPALGPAGNGGSAPYIPAQVISATYAAYPSDSVAFGTVVLDVKIGSGGSVKKVSVVHGVEALTGPSIVAAKTWGFSPATRNGKVVESHTVVAFVFPSPAAGTQ